MVRGNILLENVIFIALNLLFIGILIGFIFLQGEGKAVSEDTYAKQIALLIDASEPDTNIYLNIEKILSQKDDDFPSDRVISIDDNLVRVKLSEKSESTYPIFNSVSVNGYLDTTNSNEYIIVVRGKNE